MKFFKKYYSIALILLVVGIFFYDYLFIQDFKNNYKKNGNYTVGKVKEVKPYGRGTGYNFVYTFIVNGKKYTSVCDIGTLSFSTAQKKIGEKCLIVYLNNDIHNNRLYSTILINDSLNNDTELRKWIDSNSNIKSKIDSVPSPGYFSQNYF